MELLRANLRLIEIFSSTFHVAINFLDDFYCSSTSYLSNGRRGFSIN